MNHGKWCFQAYDMLIYFDCSKSGKFNGKPQCQCLVKLISMGWAPVILTASMDGVSTIKHCFLRNQVLEARWSGCHGMEIRSDTASKKKNTWGNDVRNNGIVGVQMLHSVGGR